MGWGWINQDKAIVIRKDDVVRVSEYARDYMRLRDYLMIRLPMKIGLRTSEICTFRIEDINLRDRSFRVLDSKKKEKFPLPLDMITLELILNLIDEREKGFVFRRLTSRSDRTPEQPLTRKAVYLRIRQIGEEAGVEGFHPRVLRRYFAAMWVYGDPALPPQQRKRGSLETLRRILRHSHLGVTSDYVSKLVFFEDMQREYQELQANPIMKRGIRTPAGDISNCIHKETCKHYAPGSSEICIHKETCRYYAAKTESMSIHKMKNIY